MLWHGSVAGFACGNLIGAKTAFAFCGVCVEETLDW